HGAYETPRREDLHVPGSGPRRAQIVPPAGIHGLANSAVETGTIVTGSAGEWLSRGLQQIGTVQRPVELSPSTDLQLISKLCVDAAQAGSADIDGRLNDVARLPHHRPGRQAAVDGIAMHAVAEPALTGIQALFQQQARRNGPNLVLQVDVIVVEAAGQVGYESRCKRDSDVEGIRLFRLQAGVASLQLIQLTACSLGNHVPAPDRVLVEVREGLDFGGCRVRRQRPHTLLERCCHDTAELTRSARVIARAYEIDAYRIEELYEVRSANGSLERRAESQIR